MPTATINGVTLSYMTWGIPGDLPIILLHAFPLHAAMWQQQAEFLAREYKCQVVLPDLRGFGNSSVPPGPYPMEVMASDIIGLADHLNFDRFVLGGLSMGGYITMAALRQAPERIMAIILADTKSGPDPDPAKIGREEMAIRAEQQGANAVAEVMPPRLLLPETTQHNWELVQQVQIMISSNSPTGIAGASRGMALRQDSLDVLSNYKGMTLILVGDQDSTTPESEARKMFEAMSSATLNIIPHAAHLSNLENSEAFNNALLHFLQSLPTT
jgi:3-oxoadipate enol-lactonase